MFDKYNDIRLKKASELIINEYNKQFALNKDKIIEYLKNNKEKVSIDLKTFSYLDGLKIGAGMISLEGKKIVDVNEDVSTYHFNGEFSKLVEENLSKDVEELNIPYEFIKRVKLDNYKNLKKLNICQEHILNQSELNRLIPSLNGKIDAITGKLGFDKELIKNSIYITDRTTEIINYKNQTIKNNDYPINGGINVYSKNILNDIDKILEILNNQGISEIISIEFCEKIDFVKKEIKGILRNETVYSNQKIKYSVTNDLKELTISDVENIEDIVRIVDAFKNSKLEFTNVKVVLENKNYKNINMLKKIDKDLKIQYDKGFNCCSLEEFIAMRETLNYYKSLIEGKNFSQLEKVIFAYDLIKSFEYQESEEKSDSRAIHSIVRDGKIVCVGFAKFFTQLLNEMGIEGESISVRVLRDGQQFGHARNITKIDDDKYNIHGVYAFDPTWDCAHNIVKYIDADGKERIKEIANIKDGEKILKHYDNLSLYNYFLVPGSLYSSIFADEMKPKSDDPNKENSLMDSGELFKSSINLDPDTFAKLIETVRLNEGYSVDNIGNTISDVLELNKKSANLDRRK